MRAKDQRITDDGFDRNVAVKMPKIRKEEEPLPEDPAGPPSQVLEESRSEPGPAPESSGKQEEKQSVFLPPEEKSDKERPLDVLGLVEDLHTQLLASSQIKRALEMDLSARQKTIHQLAEDNKELRAQIQDLKKELQLFKELKTESNYLKEENEDALGRIRTFQEELRAVNETLSQARKEKDEALARMHDLEQQAEQKDILQIKGRMKEREVSLLSDENQELRSRMEEMTGQHADLEKRYEALKKSFHEVKESLTFLRDSWKMSYYNLPQNSE